MSLNSKLASLPGSVGDPYAGAIKGKIYIDERTRDYVFLDKNENLQEGRLPDTIDLSRLSDSPENSELKEKVLAAIMNPIQDVRSSPAPRK